MAIASSHLPHALFKKLQDAGLMPQECTKWSVTLEVGSPIRIVSEAHISMEAFGLLCDALAAENVQAAHDIIFRDRFGRPGEAVGRLNWNQGNDMEDLTERKPQ